MAQKQQIELRLDHVTQENIKFQVQIKKLEDSNFIKIQKKFENNYPLTSCKITSKGKKSFELFFESLKAYKQD